MDRERFLRLDPNTDANANPNTHADADPDADSYTDPNTDPDTDSYSGLRSLCCRSRLCVEPGRHQCRRLLSMYGTGLVLVDRGVVLRAGNRLGLDFCVDPSDCRSLQRHAYAYAYAYAYANTDTYSDPYADPNSYADANTDADTDTEFRVQPIQGHHGQHQLEYRCNAKHRRWLDAADHHGHAFA